jgi:hypothetical protein
LTDSAAGSLPEADRSGAALAEQAEADPRPAARRGSSGGDGRGSACEGGGPPEAGVWAAALAGEDLLGTGVGPAVWAEGGVPEADRSDPVVGPTDAEAMAAGVGRPLRGVVEVAARCVCGLPLVARTRPLLDDGTPFPTTYYLTHPLASKVIGRLESAGVMAAMSRRLQADSALAAGHQAAHLDYLRRRAELGSPPELAGVSAGGMPNRIKCLHALAAHALAVGPGVNPVGDWTLVLASPNWRPDQCLCHRVGLGGEAAPELVGAVRGHQRTAPGPREAAPGPREAVPGRGKAAPAPGEAAPPSGEVAPAPEEAAPGRGKAAPGAGRARLGPAETAPPPRGTPPGPAESPPGDGRARTAPANGPAEGQEGGDDGGR